jgi:hypothetical protein
MAPNDYRYEKQPVRADFGNTEELAFGELKVGTISPLMQLSFPYTIVPEDYLVVRSNKSGTVESSTGLLSVSSGADANSSAEGLSRQLCRYRPGQGIIVRQAGIFSPGVEGNTQFIGIGTAEDGYFFGYNGTTFGALHRRAGVVEARTLTVTTKSSTAENITITLNGDVKLVAVTNGADATVTANEIAAADYSDTGLGWTTYVAGNKVTFVSWRVGSKAGVYSLSLATTAVGTFSQDIVGSTTEDHFIPQSTWNTDKLDGTGESGMTLKPTSGNVFQISFQWLGFGNSSFYIEDDTTGRFIEVHRIHYTNSASVPVILNPTLPLYVSSINTSNTTNVVLKTSSMMAGIQGTILPGGHAHGATNIKTATTTEVPILRLRNKIIYGNNLNRVDLQLQIVSACAAGKDATGLINFYDNATGVGDTWVDVKANHSLAEVSKTATSFTGGTLVFSLPFGGAGQQTLLLPINLTIGVINPGDSITATIKHTGVVSDITVALNWIELL